MNKIYYIKIIALCIINLTACLDEAIARILDRSGAGGHNMTVEHLRTALFCDPAHSPVRNISGEAFHLLATRIPILRPSSAKHTRLREIAELPQIATFCMILNIPLALV